MNYKGIKKQTGWFVLAYGSRVKLFVNDTGCNLATWPNLERNNMDKSNMSEEFHDWLEQCPAAWSKKHGEAVYTFWEPDEDEE